MRLIALSLVLLALGGCCYDGYDRVDQRYYGSSPTADIYISADWYIPHNAYGGYLIVDIDDICWGCSGTIAWDEWDQVESVGFEVYDAPYEGWFGLNGWYEDDWGWVNVCDDPPYVNVDGWRLDPWYDEYYDSYGWNCDVVYYY